MEISGDVLSTADMVVQRRDGPRRLREIDDDEGSKEPQIRRGENYTIFQLPIICETILPKIIKIQ